MNSGGTPCPLSRIESRTLAPSEVTSTHTRPPVSVNLSAFESRFQTTCWSRSLSPFTEGTLAAKLVSIAIFLAAAPGATTSTAACATSTSETVSIFNRSLPLMMRAMSSRSSTRRICDMALRSMTSSAWARDRTDGCVCRIRVQPMTAFNGVRISCDSVARNSSFSREASSAIRRASSEAAICVRSSRSEMTRSVTSSMSVIVPTTVCPLVSGSIRADCAISVSPAP